MYATSSTDLLSPSIFLMYCFAFLIGLWLFMLFKLLGHFVED